MLKIAFNQEYLDIFIENISTKLNEYLIGIMNKLSDEEATLLCYIKEDIGITNILKAVPNNVSFTGSQKIIDIIEKVENEINRLESTISRTITKKDFESYIKTLQQRELKKIINTHNISVSGRMTNNILIKTLLEKDIRYFDRKSRIKYSKLYFKKQANKILNNVFVDFYNKKWNESLNYTKYDFVNKINLKSCPYCNMNYIFIVEEDKLRPEIDHFYPKSKYPYLAMSYFNLIPSCQVCNRTKSSAFSNEMVNPYSDINNDNNIKFTINIQNVDFLQLKEKKYNFNSFKIKIKETTNDNVTKFSLEKLYEQHKDIVLDLLIKQQYYPKKYVSFLRTFSFTEDEIYRYLIGNYNKDEDLHKRPLSKLTKDIVDELNLMRK